MAPELRSIRLADGPHGWVEAGFDVDDGRTVVGGVALAFSNSEQRGVLGWSLTDVATGSIDGLDTFAADPDQPPAVEPAIEHPNGTVSIDHVVAASPDLPRTTTALEAVGIEARRTRDTDQYGGPMRQVFFRVGRPILELIGPPEPMDDRPATFFGLALTVTDLDATKDLLGDRLGDPKDAVQPGRRIATLRHKDLGITVPIAFMSA